MNSIVAYDNKQGIGKQGTIPWHNQEDMKYFREKTLGMTIVMGYKTYLSIGKALKDRTNIIITRNKDKIQEKDAIILSDPRQLSDLNLDPSKVFIIGGSEIYEWFFKRNLIFTSYETKIPGDYDCDRHFGKYGKWNNNHFISEEQQILDLFKEVLTKKLQPNRTKIAAMTSFSHSFKFNLRDGKFPLCTTRKMSLRMIFEELMFFLSGKTNTKILEEKGVNIWTKNTSREFLNSRNLQALPEGDIGHTYSFSFRHFGADYGTCLDDYSDKGFDQLSWLINEIKTNPESRRLIISLWEPNRFTKASLPPCLMLYQFHVQDGELSCICTQRSSDLVVAAFWNIASASLFLNLIASTCSLKVGELTWNVGNAHIYENLIDAAKEQSKRIPTCFPILEVKKRENINDYVFADLKLDFYYPQQKISVIMNP